MELLESSGTLKKRPPLNIKKEIGKYLRKWPWFLLSLLLFYVGAKIYLRYAEPQFLTTSTLKIQGSKNSSTDKIDISRLGMGISGDNDIKSEPTIILSRPILEAVANNLNLHVAFFSIGNVKELELYQNAPYTGKIISIKDPSNFSKEEYTITPVGHNSYRISGTPGVHRFKTPVQMSFGVIQIDVKAGTSVKDPIKVLFSSTDHIARRLEKQIKAIILENKGGLMELSLTGPNAKKNEDILTELSKQYIIDGIKDKNLEAQNSQAFIDDRLTIISGDLSNIERDKENFKKSNQITDLESQAGLALTNADENTKKMMESSMQLDLVNSVINAAGGGEQLLPSGLGLSTGVEASINEYNSLVLNRNRVLKQATGDNPAVIELNKQIAGLKTLIRKNLLESRETLELQLAQANAQLNMAKGEINKFPTREKVFRSIERQQNLKEQLYLYLLQKREENAIALAVNTPKAKVINPAYTSGIVAPDSSQILHGALAAGFLLPLVLLMGLNALDTKVLNKHDILAVIPNTTVIAEIPLMDADKTMVQPNDFSVFAESFRILASNLKFLLKAKGFSSGGTILITSSVKGEGKTTVSYNTALTLAGKSKTILIGADIRNPQLHRFVDSPNRGLTDYLISDETLPDSFIISSGISPNLDLLFSGAIAPNPNDLLDMQKFSDMIAYLKERYEYVIIDSAPVMLVSDTLLLVQHADVVLYVAKSDFTEIEMIDFANGFQKDNQIKTMNFILNGVKPENTRYGTKYGYGYYSYTHDEKPKWWKRFV